MSRGIVGPNRSMVDVTRIAARVLEESNAEGHPIELMTTAPTIESVDAAHVERIVENLVMNAVRYTPKGTPIWVSIDREADGLVITVEDAGAGVPPELRTVIFEPFRQGSQTLKHSPGVGIGLSLVAPFAQLHEGRAWCEEREGGGARFRVFLRTAPRSAETVPDHSAGRRRPRRSGGRAAPIEAGGRNRLTKAPTGRAPEEG